MKTRQQLSAWAMWVYESKWLYGMGCYGQRLQAHYATLAKSWYYTSKNPTGFKVLTKKYNAGENPRLYDCHGIVDGFRMDDGTTAEIDFDPSLDISADMEFNRVKAAGKLGVDYGPIDAAMKDNAGYGYWKSGHFGVGVGEGQVIDIWSTGYPARKRDQTQGGWDYWLKCSGIDYSDGEVIDDMLQKGSKGEAVKAWQERLIEQDPSALPKYKADQDFGGETLEWTNKFKAAVGLPQDGIVDDLTWNAMISALQHTGPTQGELDTAKAQIATLQQALDTAHGLSRDLTGRLEAVAAARDVLDQVQADFGK